MQSTVVLILVVTLLPCVHGDSSSLECARCDLGNSSCSKTNCTDTEKCVSLEVFFSSSGKSTYKGCLAQGSCTALAFTISSTSGRQVQSNMACCKTSGCNDQLTLGVPPSSSLANGVNCPVCENQNSILCEGQGEVPCTGAEAKCITLEGVSIAPSNHNFSMRGCATPSACHLVKDDIISFGGDVYKLTRNVTCKDKGGLNAIPSFATVAFPVIVGFSFANILV